MKVILLSLLSCIISFAQVIHSGSSDDQFYSPANSCTASGSCAYTDNTVVPSTLRYGYAGTTLKYDIPLANGPGIVQLGFYEPNKNGAGQRLFTVSVNGSTPITLDIYKQAGAAKRYWLMPAFNVNVIDGFVHVVLTSVNNNPLISTIQTQALVKTAPALNCNPSTACTFDPVTNTFTLSSLTLSPCAEVAANTLGTAWMNETGNVYIAHVSPNTVLDCMPGTDKIGTVVLDVQNNPIGTYFISSL